MNTDSNDEVDRLRKVLLDKHTNNPNFIASPSSSILIEGYPRSGNTFLVMLINHQRTSKGLPQLKIAHHTHRWENLRIAQIFDVPSVVLVRPPIDAISSFYVFHSGRLPVDDVALRWQEFYEFSLNILDQVTVVSFEEFAENPNPSIEKISTDLGIHIPPVKDVEGTASHIQRVITERSKGKRDEREHVSMAAVPLQERSVLKEQIVDEVSQTVERLGLYDLYREVLT